MPVEKPYKIRGLRGREVYSSVPPYRLEASQLKNIYIFKCSYNGAGAPVCPTCGCSNARTVKYGSCREDEPTDLWRVGICLTEGCRTVYKSYFNSP